MRYDEMKKLIKDKCGITKLVLDDLVSESGGKRVTVGVTDEADAAILSRNLNGLYMDGHQLFIETGDRSSTPYQPPNYQRIGAFENVGYPPFQQAQQIQQPVGLRGYDTRSVPAQNYGYSDPIIQTQFGSQQSWAPGPSGNNVQPHNNTVWINQPYPSSAPIQPEACVEMPAPQRESRRDYTQNRPSHNARAYLSPPRETYQSQSFQRTPHNMNAAGKFPSSNQQFRDSKMRSPVRGSQNPQQLISQSSAGMGGMANAPPSGPRDIYPNSTMRSYSSPPRGNQSQSSNKPSFYNMPGHEQSVGPSFRMPNFNQHGGHTLSNRNAAENVYKRDDRPDRHPPNVTNFGGQGHPRFQSPVEGSRNMPPRNENLSKQSRFDRPTAPSFGRAPQPRGQNFPTDRMPQPRSGDNYNMANRPGETNRPPQYQQRSNGPKQGPNFASNKNFNEYSDKTKFSGQPSRFDRREVSGGQSRPNTRSPDRFANKRGFDGPRVNVSSNDPKKRRHDSDHKPNSNQIPTQKLGRNGSALLTRTEYNASKGGKDSMERIHRRHINCRQQVYGAIIREMAKNVGNEFLFDDKPLKTAAREMIMSRFDAVIKNMLRATFNEIMAKYRKSYPVNTDKEFLAAIGTEADAKREGIMLGEKAPIPKREREAAAAMIPIKQDQSAAAKPSDASMPKQAKLAPGQPPAGLLPKYPNADKSQYKEMKKARVQEIQGDVHQLPAPEKAALQKHMEQIKELIKKTCEDTSPENTEDGIVLKMIIDKYLDEITKMIDLSVTKRILDVKNNLVLLIYGHPHFPHRLTFENFLKGFGVISLKKSARANFYVATCDTYENYDKLCALATTKLGGLTLKFKPHQLGGPKFKLPKPTKSNKSNIPREELKSELLALQADAEYDIQDMGDLEKEDFNEEDLNDDEQFHEDIDVDNHKLLGIKKDNIVESVDDDKLLGIDNMDESVNDDKLLGIDNMDESVNDDKLLGIDNMDESVNDDKLLGITDDIDEIVNDDKLLGINIDNIDENDLEDY